MGLPEDNPAGYQAAALTAAAGRLSGKLMLIHGTLDKNVHLQHTVRFLDALQEAGFAAPLILLPGAGHSPGRPSTCGRCTRPSGSSSSTTCRFDPFSTGKHRHFPRTGRQAMGGNRAGLTFDPNRSSSCEYTMMTL